MIYCKYNSKEEINMKRFLIFILAAAMLTSLASCAPAPEPEFTLGTVVGNVYENSFIGIGCTLGSEWTYYSEDQIREINNAAADLAGEDYQKMMESATVVYDMYAAHSNQINTVVVNLEKVDKVQLAVLDLEENFKNTIPTLEQSLGNMGFTNITSELGTVKLGGTDMTCLNVVSEIGTFKMYQTIVAIKCNGYLACITFSGDSTESIDSALSNFYWLE